MPSIWKTLRPAFTGETSYAVVVTIEGTGTIAGQVFSAQMTKYDGSPAPGSATAVVTDPGARQVTVTLPGQAVAGDYQWALRRTDNGSNLVVSGGTVEVTDPAAPNAWGNP